MCVLPFLHVFPPHCEFACYAPSAFALRLACLSICDALLAAIALPSWRPCLSQHRHSLFLSARYSFPFSPITLSDTVLLDSATIEIFCRIYFFPSIKSITRFSFFSSFFSPRPSRFSPLRFVSAPFVLVACDCSSPPCLFPRFEKFDRSPL